MCTCKIKNFKLIFSSYINDKLQNKFYIKNTLSENKILYTELINKNI